MRGRLGRGEYTEADGFQSNAAFERLGYANTKPHISLASGHIGREPKRERSHQPGLFREDKRPDRNNWLNFDCSSIQPEPISTDPATKYISVDRCSDPSSSCCTNLLYQFNVDSDTSRY